MTLCPLVKRTLFLLQGVPKDHGNHQTLGLKATRLWLFVRGQERTIGYHIRINMVKPLLLKFFMSKKNNRRLRYRIFLIGSIVLLMSCSEKKKPLSFYDNTDIEADSTDVAPVTADSVTDANTQVTYDTNQVEEEVEIPFTEQGGVKLIDVTVNRQLTVKMILDSGCSTTLISIAEARYLYEKGCIREDDFLGVTKSQIADGSIVENMVINLRELVIGNKIRCTNVTATVSENTQAPLLLGNEVLNRAPSYSVDNENKVIKFKLE